MNTRISKVRHNLGKTLITFVCRSKVSTYLAPKNYFLSASTTAQIISELILQTLFSTSPKMYTIS